MSQVGTSVAVVLSEGDREAQLNSPQRPESQKRILVQDR